MKRAGISTHGAGRVAKEGHERTERPIVRHGLGSSAAIADGVLIDVSSAALEVAARNAARNGVAERIDFLVSDCFDEGVPRGEEVRTELWAGNRERWLHMLRPSHPIRWAWSTWARRRREYEERIGRSDYAHLVVLRLRRPRDAEELLRQLMRAPEAPELSALTGFGPVS